MPFICRPLNVLKKGHTFSEGLQVFVSIILMLQQFFFTVCVFDYLSLSNSSREKCQGWLA